MNNGVPSVNQHSLNFGLSQEKLSALAASKNRINYKWQNKISLKILVVSKIKQKINLLESIINTLVTFAVLMNQFGKIMKMDIVNV